MRNYVGFEFYLLNFFALSCKGVMFSTNPEAISLVTSLQDLGLGIKETFGRDFDFPEDMLFAMVHQGMELRGMAHVSFF